VGGGGLLLLLLLFASAFTVQISPEQGQFMALLVKLMGVKNAIEVRLQR
jgi:predicted O-methyltransferase YrrM